MKRMVTMFEWVIVPAALLCAPLVASCVRKARRADASMALRDRLRVTPALWSAIGLLETAAVAGLLLGLRLPAIGVAAATGVALLMAGAVVAHVRVGATGRPLLPPAVLLGVAALTAVGFGAGG